MRFLPVLSLMASLGACHPASSRPERPAVVDDGTIRTATVVAFTLKDADTLDAEAGAEKLREFEAYTQLVFPMFEEQGIAVRSTHSDSLVVALENGPSRTIMLRGLDFPYGYVLIDPGFAETILTGVVTDEELLEEAGYYFGLENEPGDDEPKRQFVIR